MRTWTLLLIGFGIGIVAGPLVRLTRRFLEEMHGDYLNLDSKERREMLTKEGRL